MHILLETVAMSMTTAIQLLLHITNSNCYNTSPPKAATPAGADDRLGGWIGRPHYPPTKLQS